MAILKIKERLVDLAFFSILLLWSCLLAPFGWLLFLIHKMTGTRRIRSWARFAGWIYGRSSLMLLRPFLRVVSINPDEALGKTPCIITANHQSILDLYLLGFQSMKQVCPITKSWPFRLLIPLIPTMRTAGYIEAEGRNPDQIIKECKERIEERVALVVYPEGHRSRTGKLGMFHAGAFRLALDENLPIVPMVIKNSGARIQPGSFHLSPGVVEIEMLPTIQPSEYDHFRKSPIPHRALLKHVRTMYEKSLASYGAGHD